MTSSDKHHKVERSFGTHSKLCNRDIDTIRKKGGGVKKIRIQSVEMKFLRSIIGNAKRDKLQE